MKTTKCLFFCSVILSVVLGWVKQSLGQRESILVITFMKTISMVDS